MSNNVNLVHIVFRTKNSRNTIPAGDEKRQMLAYINSESERLNCKVLRINAHLNHVHILVDLHPDLPLSIYVKTIKANSSRVFSRHVDFPLFECWAKKYGSFTISRWDKDMIVRYIMNQEEHHRHKTFQEELIELFGTDVMNDKWWRHDWLDEEDPDAVPGAAGQTTIVPEYGIPHTVVADGPAGLRIQPKRRDTTETFYCTAFPTGTSLASTWDTELVEQVAQAMGNEVLEYGVDVLLGPGVNIMRNPLCGRNFEYFSEDPLVAGKIGAAYVNGVQSQGVGVSVKHYAANNQESNRLGNDAIVSQRALREIYLKPFEIIVKESTPWTIMSSYNKINGDFTQESYDLLTTILRDEWGYDGIVMTDWTNKRNTPQQIRAGNDLMMPGNQPQIDDLTAALADGSLSQEALDICVKRILEYIVKTPRYKGYKYTNHPDLKKHAQVTRQAAQDGMVLLKNSDMTLPLRKGERTALFGITSYDFISGGTGSGDVNEAYTIDMVEGLKNAGLRIDQPLAQVYADYIKLQESIKESKGERGGSFYAAKRIPELTLTAAEYDAYANKDNVAIITIGRNAGEGADRTVDDFNLTAEEQAMIKNICDAFHAKGKRVVVVINAGGVIETASWKAYPDAILVAWQPGQEGGNSVADILVGEATPSGKLTMTWPLKYEDHYSALNFPTDYTYSMDWSTTPEQREAIPNVGTTYYDEGVYVGYRYFNTADVEVSYPFGHGLSYTTFEYTNPQVVKKGNGYEARVTVTNTGEFPGREVVQLYVQAPKGDVDRPARELKAFGKTPVLQPGQSAVVTMRFDNADLAYYDNDSDQFVTVPGEYRALFGASVADIRHNVKFNAKGQTVQCHDALAQKRPNHELHLGNRGPKTSLTDIEMSGVWDVDVNLLGNPIKGDATVTRNGDSYDISMLGVDMPLTNNGDGTYSGAGERDGQDVEVVLEPLDEGRALMTIGSPTWHVSGTAEIHKK